MPRSRALMSSGACVAERERRGAELDRVDAQQNVVHDRVADQHRLVDVVARARRRCVAAAWRQVLSPSMMALVHFLQAIAVHHARS